MIRMHARNEKVTYKALQNQFNCMEIKHVERVERISPNLRNIGFSLNCVTVIYVFWTDIQANTIDPYEKVQKDLYNFCHSAFIFLSVATLLGTQHYKANTGFTSPNKISQTNVEPLTRKSLKKSDNNQCLYSPKDHMEDWQSC